VSPGFVNDKVAARRGFQKAKDLESTSVVLPARAPTIPHGAPAGYAGTHAWQANPADTDRHSSHGPPARLRRAAAGALGHLHSAIRPFAERGQIQPRLLSNPASQRRLVKARGSCLTAGNSRYPAKAFLKPQISGNTSPWWRASPPLALSAIRLAKGQGYAGTRSLIAYFGTCGDRVAEDMPPRQALGRLRTALDMPFPPRRRDALIRPKSLRTLAWKRSLL